VFICIDIF